MRTGRAVLACAIAFETLPGGRTLGDPERFLEIRYDAKRARG